VAPPTHGRRVSLRSVLLLGLALTAVVAVIALIVEPRITASPPPADVAAADPLPEPLPVAFLPLTGEAVHEVPVHPAVVVKVSNSPEARPQTGLAAADVVFEELTEGGVTRFVAVFHGEVPEVVGPVRSARPVDTQLLPGFGAPIFAFSGARPEVRQLIAATPAIAVDEADAAFFRDDGTYASHPVAPHDLFVRPTAALASTTGHTPLRDPGWTFSDEVPALASTDGQRLAVEMSTAFTTHWRFDPEVGFYRRSQDRPEASPSSASRPDTIGAANVVVLDVHHYLGASGYPETDAIGEGAAVVLRDGRRFDARWSKASSAAPLRILTVSGEAFPLRPGPTWMLLPDALPDP
jgi:hypothetical protein